MNPEGENPTVPVSTGGDNRPETRLARTAEPAPTHVSDGSLGDGGGGAGEQAAAPPTTPAETQPWTGPSREEWTQAQEVLQGLSQLLNPTPEGAEEGQYIPTEEELQNMDIAELLDYAVDSRLQPLLPYLESSARNVGEQVEQQELQRLAKEKGDFDEKLAHYVAESIYQSGESGGDPIKALEMGAEFAANQRKQEREAGVNAYKESLSKPLNREPGISGGATFTKDKPKSYDDVVDAWAHQSEV